MDAKALIAAVSEVAESKGLSGEAVIQALELALEKAYIKVLGGSTPDLPDPVVKCVIDPESGKIYLAQVKKVVEEVNDDFLEIDEEEANEGLFFLLLSFTSKTVSSPMLSNVPSRMFSPL